jgi:hypothetical protein
MRSPIGSLSLVSLVLVAACGGVSGNRILGADGGEGSDAANDGGGSDDGRGGQDGRAGDAATGDGGCIEETPTRGAPCTTSEVLCHPGNVCCSGRWTCDGTTHEWGLVVGNCACVEAGSGEPDSSGGSFPCGPGMECRAATQYCLKVNGHLGGMKPSYECRSPDGGGGPSCDGMGIAKAPGDCGCYKSPSGAVTITECPP